MNKCLDEFLGRFQDNYSSYNRYRNLLKSFFNYLDEEGKDIEDFSWKDLENYLELAPLDKPKHYSESTLKQIKHVVKEFLRWHKLFVIQRKYDGEELEKKKSEAQDRLDRIDYIEVPNDTEGIFEKGERKALNLGELEMFLNKVSMTRTRDYCIFYILGYTGMRSGELDIDRFLEINRNKKKLKLLTEKNNKPRVLFFSEEAWKYFEKIMDRGWIDFSSHRIWELANRYKPLFDEEVNFSPHSFRHTFRSHMNNVTRDKQLVKVMMGHFGGDTSDGYDETFDEEIKKAMVEDHYYNKLNLPD